MHGQNRDFFKAVFQGFFGEHVHKYDFAHKLSISSIKRVLCESNEKIKKENKS